MMSVAAAPSEIEGVQSTFCRAGKSRQLISGVLDLILFGVPMALSAAILATPFFAINFYLVLKYPGGDSLPEDTLVASSDEALFISGLLTILLGMIGILSVSALLYTTLLATVKRSPGMALLGLELVSTDQFTPVTAGQGFLRGVILTLSSIASGGVLGLLFWLSPLFDSTSGWAQSWQDKIVNAVVIDTKKVEILFAR